MKLLTMVMQSSLLLWALCVIGPKTASVAVAQSTTPRLFFDADQSSFNFKSADQVFEGNVVMIGAGLIMAADKIDIQAKRKIISAQGHVVFMTKDQIFLGDKITYFQETDRVAIEEGSVTFNGVEDASKAIDEVLGFSSEELAFETARIEKVKNIDKRIIALSDEYAQLSEQDRLKSNKSYQDRLRILIEKRELIANQTNPILNRKSDRIQQSIANRRAYWRENRVKETLSTKRLQRLGYFRIIGERLEKLGRDEFSANNALFTSCWCEEGESPAWGFWTKEMDVSIDGYANFWHPILKVKGIPVLYLPYLRVPVKHRRQSGLLLPNFSYSRLSGTTFTQPLFIDLGPTRDMTLTESILTKRGFLHEFEYRHKQKQYSGWQVSLGLINDQVWRDEISNRKALRTLYQDGLAAARANPSQTPAATIADGKDGAAARIAEPDFWDSKGRSICVTGDEASYENCQRDIDIFTNTPKNSWRGYLKWQGLNYFSPRLSLVTKGEFHSDHRYGLDFDAGYDLLQGDLLKSYTTPYARTGARLQYDGSHFYLGIGSSFGDYKKLDDSYMGRQLPIYMLMRSKYYNILPAQSPIPLYINGSLDYRRIAEFEATQYELINKISRTLGHGHWSRVGLDFLSPLFSGWIFQVDHYTELEARQITHENLEKKNSGKTSLRTGLNVRMPLDGKFRIPAAFLPEEYNAEGKQKYVHHLMSWNVGFSYRPFVDAWGPYARTDNILANDGTGLSYFPTDRPSIVGQSDTGIIDEEVLVKHQRMSFGTRHTFRVYDNVFNKNTSSISQTVQNRKLSYLQRSKQILSIAEKQGRYDAGSRVNRPYSVPLTVSASIDYDLLDAEERRAQKKKKEEDPNTVVTAEPWKELETQANLQTMGFVFDYQSSYNFYQESFAKNSFVLRLPRTYDTRLSFGYSFKRDQIIADAASETNVNLARTRYIDLNTQVIPHVGARVYLAKRTLEQESLEVKRRSEYLTRYSLTYLSPSKCWGLEFARVKDFHEENKDASYLLRLNINFAGHVRDLPNMGSSILPKVFGDR